MAGVLVNKRGKTGARREQAVVLRAQGWAMPRIAAEIGISHQAVSKHIERALAEGDRRAAVPVVRVRTKVPSP